MKKSITRIITFILIIVLICVLIPTFTKRIHVENKNTNITVSLYYNDIANRLRGKKLDKAINDFKDIGVTTLSFSEENLNSMVARGDITNIKYNVLRHKYDDESIEISKQIEKEIPDIIYDSQLIITKDPETAEFLSETLSHRFTPGKEYKKIININSKTGVETTVFCLYDGTYPIMDVQLGYNEKMIKKYSDEGFDICLVLRFFNSSETGYIDNIERMIKEYNIKHISIRAATVGPEDEKEAEIHYKKISDLINKYDLTLVVTENANQLANETPFGYKHIFKENNNKVMRSYETYDASQSQGDKTKYMFRYHQYLNSTIDRNIRFITVSQIHISYTTYEECTELTLKAIDKYIDKVKELGYSVNGHVPELDYDVDLRIPNAVATAIMVLMVYLIVFEILSTNKKVLFVLSIFIAIIGAIAAYFMPSSYHWMFPTAWAVLSPCFTLTYVIVFLKRFLKNIPIIPLSFITIFILTGLMSLFGIVQSTLLSGINYYVNNEIFRGIKLSLFIPLIYAIVIFVVFFTSIDYKKMAKTVLNFRIGDIKVSWLIFSFAILFIMYKIVSIYITRSGNVNSISSIEAWMRNFITEVFEARPRTKEFLVGYPCLVLFVYYMKKTNIKLIQGLLFCGASITAASIANSFCHVFTTVETIYGRVINGVILGVLVSIVAYIANLILIKIVTKLFNKFVKPAIIKNDSVYSIYKTIIGERD